MGLTSKQVVSFMVDPMLEANEIGRNDSFNSSLFVDTSYHIVFDISSRLVYHRR